MNDINYFKIVYLCGVKSAHYSYTMVCPHVREDNPRVKRVDYLTYRWTTLYNLSVDLAHLGIFCAKVGKDGIKTSSILCN